MEWRRERERRYDRCDIEVECVCVHDIVKNEWKRNLRSGVRKRANWVKGNMLRLNGQLSKTWNEVRKERKCK